MGELEHVVDGIVMNDGMDLCTDYLVKSKHLSPLLC